MDESCVWPGEDALVGRCFVEGGDVKLLRIEPRNDFAGIAELSILQTTVYESINQNFQQSCFDSMKMAGE